MIAQDKWRAMQHDATTGARGNAVSALVEMPQVSGVNMTSGLGWPTLTGRS